MLKVADRLSVNCFNPGQNFFLWSTERGFIEPHTKAWFHNRALAGFLKILQRMSQPTAVGGKRINDLSVQVSLLQKTVHGGCKGVPPDRRTQNNGVISLPVNMQWFQFRAIALGILTLSLIDNCIITAIVGNNRINADNIPADFLLNHLGNALCVAAIGVIQNQSFHFMFPSLYQRLSTEHGKYVKFTVVSDVFHIFESLHVFLGDCKIHVRIVCHVGRICCLGKRNGSKLKNITDA